MLSEIERGTDPNLSVAAEEEISLLDFLIVIARNLRLIVTVAFSFAVVATIVVLLLHDRYTATTTILPPQNNSTGTSMMAQLASAGSIVALGAGSLGLKNPNDLQIALLKSRTVEDAMLDRFHLQLLYHSKHRSDARKRLEAAVDIASGSEKGSKDELIRISVTDPDPQRAADMANGYVDEFRKFSSTLAVTEASQRRLFFEQQLVQAKDNLANAEEELEKTQQKTGLIQLDSQYRALIESVAQLSAQIAAKEVQIRAMRTFAAGQNPELESAEQELAALQEEQNKLGASSNGASNALLIHKGVMPESGVDYVRRLRDVKYFETIFDLLARQLEAAKIDEARQGATIQIVDRAVVPDHHSSPKRTFIVVGATVLGVILGLSWAFVAEGLARLSKDRVTRSQLERLKQLISFRSN